MHNHTSRTAMRPDTGERGITLVETLMVLGIATAFIAGSLALYNQATNASRQRDAVNAIYGVIGQIRSQYATADNYAALTMLPSGAPTNPFTGAFTAFATGTPTTADATIAGSTHFVVGMPGIPLASCQALLTTFSSTTGGIDVHLVPHATAAVALTAATYASSTSALVTTGCLANNIIYFRTD